MINEIFKFVKKPRKTFQASLTTRFLVVSIFKQVNGEYFGVSYTHELSELAKYNNWRQIVADTLRKLRYNLRIDIARRNKYFVAAPNYRQAQYFARYMLRLPNSCWHYIDSLDDLIGLKRGLKIHVVNGGPNSSDFQYAFRAYCAQRKFKIVNITLR